MQAPGAAEPVHPLGKTDPDLALGSRALEQGLVRAAQFAQALEDFRQARTLGKPILFEEILVGYGWITAQDVERLRRDEALRAEGIPVLDRYEIQSKLGEGATATVFRGWDRELKRPVAVKFLRDTSGMNARVRERFRREAQTAAGLDHPNVLRIFDAGETSGHLYLVMELVEGRALETILRERSHRLPELLALLERAARGVAAAHATGVVHRDLKPANILLTRSGEPKIADFGIAFNPVVSGDLTRTGVTLGTPLYMSPEQVRGRKEASPRSDVFSFGAILYEAAIGQPPFAGQTLTDIYGKILDSDPVPPRRAVKTVPRDLESLILKCLEKDPSRRYADAGALADDLRRYLAGEPVEARPISGARRVLRWARRKRALLLPAAALLLAAAGGFSWMRVVDSRTAHRVDALLREAAAREAEGKLDDARAAFRSALDLEPERSEAAAGLRRTGEAIEAALRRKAKEEAARSGAYRLLEQGRARLDVAIGYQYSRTVPTSEFRSRLEEARREIAAGVEADPAIALGHYLLGRACEMLGDDRTAEASYRAAAARDAGSGLFRYHLGRFLMHRAARRIVDELARWTTSNVDSEEILQMRIAENWENAPATEAQVAEAGAEIEKAAALRAGIEDEMQADLAAVMIAFTKKDWDAVRRRCADSLRKFAGRPGLEEYHFWLALTPGSAGERKILMQPVRELGQVYGFQVFVAVPNSEAAKHLDRALEFHPRFPLALMVRSLFLIQAGSFARARKDLDAALELRPGLASAYVARAMIRDKQKEAAEAAADLDRALEAAAQPSDRRDAHLIRFAMLRDQGDETGARTSLDLCVESDPTDWLSRYIRAEERLRLGNPAAALEDLERCLQSQPRFTHGMERRGFAYLTLKKYDLALRDYSEALRLGPKSPCGPMNLMYRAEVYRESGKFPEALADVTKSINATTSVVVKHEAYRVRARVYLQLGRYDEALNDVDALLEIAKDDKTKGWTWHMRGIVQTLRGDHRAAIESLNRSIDLHPEAAVFFVRATARRAANDPKGAAEDARRALRMNPLEAQRPAILKLLEDLGEKP